MQTQAVMLTAEQFNQLATKDYIKDYVDKRFDAVDQRFDAVDQRFDAVDQRFDKLEGLLSETREKVFQIDESLSSISKKLDDHIINSEFKVNRLYEELREVDYNQEIRIRRLEKKIA